MLAVHGSGIDFQVGSVVHVRYSAGDPENYFGHIVSKFRFNGESVYFELMCEPGAWRREHRAEEVTVPTCLLCVASRFG